MTVIYPPLRAACADLMREILKELAAEEPSAAPQKFVEG
jgi:hypothetical protein